MSRTVVLDSNIYIGAIRDPDKAAALDVFLERNAPITYMSAVVMQELRAGAVTDRAARALDKVIFNAFERGPVYSSVAWLSGVLKLPSSVMV